jgi:hypothetical protein
MPPANCDISQLEEDSKILAMKSILIGINEDNRIVTSVAKGNPCEWGRQVNLPKIKERAKLPKYPSAQSMRALRYSSNVEHVT